MSWSFNIDEAPRGKTVQTKRLVTDRNSASGQSLRVIEDFVPDYLWLATKCGKVIKSYWIEATKFSPARWAGLGTTEVPVAWQHFVTPEHPVDQGEMAA
ncbi:hypothetical protein LPB79_13070 [Rhizobium sp. T136]|uniref:hypothetical protein n=1 Tax=Rhizobium sp. T136 TaxID=555319 RepID=UPI001E5E596D|nr:hypothetical protein [Rhizobium sp. T136]UFS83178.1 hypothetical protein LPB79_13070 [Rhizobium sp. T136]